MDKIKEIFISIFSLRTMNGLSIETTKEINNLYLIPQDFEGTMVIFYEVENQPSLAKEGKYTVIPVKSELLNALKDTNMHEYSIHMTSSEMEDEGILKNKHYYVNENGERTLIDEYCIHESGFGSFTVGNEEEIIYETLQVTNSQSSESFFLAGNEDYYIQKSELMKYWQEKF